MKRLTAMVLALALVSAIVGPVAASAGPGKSGQRERPAAAGQKSAEKQARKTERDAEKAVKRQSKQVRKAERAQERAAAKAEREQARGTEPSASADVTPSVAASSSVDTTPAVSNAFGRITANIEKSLAKIADGRKTRVPPGLIRVWLKFAGWLGVDPTTMPAPQSGSPADPTGVPTSTAEPTGTVTPDPTDPTAPPA